MFMLHLYTSVCVVEHHLFIESKLVSLWLAYFGNRPNDHYKNIVKIIDTPIGMYQYCV